MGVGTRGETRPPLRTRMGIYFSNPNGSGRGLRKAKSSPILPSLPTLRGARKVMEDLWCVAYYIALTPTSSSYLFSSSLSIHLIPRCFKFFIIQKVGDKYIFWGNFCCTTLYKYLFIEFQVCYSLHIFIFSFLLSFVVKVRKIASQSENKGDFNFLGWLCISRYKFICESALIYFL